MDSRVGRDAERRIRTYHEVSDPAGEDVLAQVGAQERRLAGRLERIGRIVAVASGKGGVGKSAVAANLAAALAQGGHRVGAADADLNGPSLARMLGAKGPLRVRQGGVEPATGAAGVRVVSMDLLLSASDAPVRWKGPAAGGFIWQSTLETGALREFLSDVAWGELDILLIDAPPGTDKLARLLELLPRLDTLVLVTTPSGMAGAVVARSVRLARETGAQEIGLVANMTAYRCPHCGVEEPLYAADGARALAEAAGLELWAEIPFEPALAAATDAGRPWILEAAGAVDGSPACRALQSLAGRLAGGMSGEGSG
ncbi:MAG TPA: P-loop NTPase [Gemmatimonadota bacterium]|nr:P-loop NTPase [Gemmatimonadota bacterium]